MAVLTKQPGTSFTQSALTAVREQITDSIAALLAQYRQRKQIKNERLILASLPDHLLSDIGLTRSNAVFETKKKWNDVPLWRI